MACLAPSLEIGGHFTQPVDRHAAWPSARVRSLSPLQLKWGIGFLQQDALGCEGRSAFSGPAWRMLMAGSNFLPPLRALSCSGHSLPVALQCRPCGCYKPFSPAY